MATLVELTAQAPDPLPSDVTGLPALDGTHKNTAEAAAPAGSMSPSDAAAADTRHHALTHIMTTT
jgi:hypothetical protein